MNQGGQISHFSKPGMNARFAANGNLNYAHVAGPDRGQMTIHRPLQGGRIVETVRPDHSRVVVTGTSSGYLERPLARRGFVARTYVAGGRSYAVVYRTYRFRGIVYPDYMPAWYYAPVFYTWAVDPWPRPALVAWSWRAAPWFRFYSAYFSPRPVYTSAALWLTDFLLAENLRQAYENGPAAAAPPQGASVLPGAALTPEIRQAIADEVQRQIQAEQNTAAPAQPAVFGTNDAPPPALDPNQRLFVVSSNLDLEADGGSCPLAPGDVLLRSGDAVASGNRVDVSVLSSQPGDCPASTAAQLDVAALQEMHNQFRQQIDAGLKTLAENRGHNGLPNEPPADARTAPDGQAIPDSGAAAALQQQSQAADQTEAEIQQQVGGPSADDGSSPPVTAQTFSAPRRYYAMVNGALEKWDFETSGAFLHQGVRNLGIGNSGSTQRGTYAIQGNAMLLETTKDTSSFMAGSNRRLVGAGGSSDSAPARSLSLQFIGPDGQDGIVLDGAKFDVRHWN